MLQFLSSQILFYISIILVLFIPGYFLLLAIESRKKIFSDLERLVFSIGLSIISVNFLMILMGKIGIFFTRLSIILVISAFSVACFAIYKLIKLKREKSDSENIDPETAFSFSRNQKILVIALLFLTIFIKTAYLKNSIFPTSTDLGHHMYWSKTISETGKLPIYQESDIIQENGNYAVSQPEKIADFIIGEHLIFSAINLVSGINFISYFPSLVLFLIHIAGIFSIFILTIRFFEKYSFGKNAAIFSLFLIGPLYAISSSQAKFVSGGVIGNTIGNLLIPMTLYFLFRAFKEKNSNLLSLGIVSAVGLAYTHHLSAFIFLFVFAFIAIIFSVFNLKNIFFHVKEWFGSIFKPQVIIILILSILFFVFAYTPTYVDSQSVGTAVGGPSKETRAGLTFNQLKTTAGEARMVLGLIGIVILLGIKNRKNYENAFALGWCISLLVMSLKPQWLFLDLPSTRIANYVSFPLAVSGAFALAYFFEKLKSSENKYFTDQKTLCALFFMLFAFLFTSGFYDNSQSINTQSNFEKAVQTFSASEYLASKTNSDDKVLKDHNYITADSWIKLYFNRDYNFPFSRGYFKRYEDATKPREMCTLWMISEPNTPEGQKCFNDLGVNFLMVNRQFDSAQFQKSERFWQIYSGNEINVYYRK